MMRRLALLALLASCSHEPEPARASLSVGQFLSAPADARFARALQPRAFVFPDDHGAHSDFQTEWWYFTGNLAGPDGREFGYQVTFFRRAVAFEAPPGDSAWSTRDVYMAHFALSDAGSGEFRAFERFERAALGLAGVESSPWRVWLRDWSASGDFAGELRLVARAGDVALDLTLRAAKPPVLQGDAGLSRKGAEPGNASYYYSIPRLESQGTLEIGGRESSVRGESWFDREWSTSALDAGQVGWDWFALRFDDATELMLYRMRRADGSADETSSGSFVAADGSATRLAARDFRILELEHWTSPTSGARYPSRWRVEVPAIALSIEVEPLLPHAELELSVRYWEGAVRAGGTRAGRGFVELTGY